MIKPIDFAAFEEAMRRALHEQTPQEVAEREQRAMADEAKLRLRADGYARDAVGKTMTVRTSMKTTVTGEIVEAKFARFRYTERRMQVVWKIVVKSGKAGTRHTFHVRSLPR